MAYPADVRGLLQEIRDTFNVDHLSTSQYPDSIYGLWQNIRDLLNTDSVSFSHYDADIRGIMLSVRDLINTDSVLFTHYTTDQLGILQSIRDIMNIDSLSTAQYPAGVYGTLQNIRNLAAAFIADFGSGTPDAPTLTLTSGATDNTPDFTLTGDLAVNDVIRFAPATASDFSGASETTHTISSGEDAANTFSFSTGSLADGTWYFRARIERGALISEWSNTQTETIDATAPTITTASTANCAENATLAISLTADEMVTWAIRSTVQNGASLDAAKFEISGTTLRWASNGTKDFESPDDSNTNNTYVVVVRATDTAGNTTDKTITVTVTDVSEETVYGPKTLAGTDGNWKGQTIVQTIVAANLVAHSGTQARLTFKFETLNVGCIVTAYFGQQASSGDPYDFSGSQQHVLFSGTDISGDNITLDYVSDWFNLGEAYDNTKNYVLAVQFVGVGNVRFPTTSSTGDWNYFKDPAAEAAVTDKSGYGGNLANAVDLLTKIEVSSGHTVAPTTVYGPYTISNADTGWRGYTFVRVLAAANLGPVTGTQVRLTLKFSALGSGVTATSYFGQQAGSGDVYDFNGNQAHMLFSGSDISGNGSTVDFVSDWITLGEAYDETKNYVFAIQFVGASGSADILIGDVLSAIGDVSYHLFGSADAATTNKSGYSADGSFNNKAVLVTKVEIR